MPVRPELRHHYRGDWPVLSYMIRMQRAGGRCECSSSRKHTTCGKRHFTADGRCREHDGTIARTFRGTVRLTVAHLDHDPTNRAESNLLALCQACHLRHDADHHVQTRRRRRAEAIARVVRPLQFSGLAIFVALLAFARAHGGESTEDARALAHQLTAPQAERPLFLVDNESVVPQFVDPERPWQDVSGCPGWQQLHGRFMHPNDAGELEASVVGFEASRFANGLLLVDFFNTDASSTSTVHSIELVDQGTVLQVFPGAGVSLTLGLSQPLDVYATGYPTNSADRNPAGGFYPDVVFSGQTGSPRNRFVPAYWSLIGRPPASAITTWAHAYRYCEFQALRPLQRVDGDGVIDVDAWIDAPKTWPKRTLNVGGNERVLDAYSTNHVAAQELATIFLADRDPRAWRQLKALAVAVLEWDWYVGERGVPATSRSTLTLGNNSRMEGRALECCAWVYRAAVAKGDSHLARRVAAHAERLVRTISDSWTGWSPTAQWPDGRHLNEPWDASWMIGLIGWGAALCDAFIGTPGARALAERVADFLERAFARAAEIGMPGCLFKDAPADGELRRATWFYDWRDPRALGEDVVGMATSRWCAPVFQALGRTSSPLYLALTEGALHFGAKYALDDVTVVLHTP